MRRAPKLDRELYDLVSGAVAIKPSCVAALERVESERTRNGVPIVSRGLGRLLYMLVVSSRATRVIEIGTSIGYSAIWLAAAASRVGGHVVSVEIDAAVARIAEANLRDAGLSETCSVVVGSGASVLRESDEPIDLLFLDAAKEDYLDYLDSAWNRLADGTLIVCDNAFFDAWPDSNRRSEYRARHRAFVERIVRHPELETHLVPGLEGVALSVRRQGYDGRE